MARRMDDADKRRLLDLKETPGWKVFIGKVVKQQIRFLEERTARHRYASIDELLLDQAQVRVYENLESLVDEFINADDER